MRVGIAPRSRDAYLAAVAALQVESNPDFLPGAGLTHCNQYVRAVLERLGVRIPAMLANDLFGWFSAPAAAGWRRIDRVEAKLQAELGYPTIGVWRNPKGPHGHICLVVPAPAGADRMYSAQAGLKNWGSSPIERSGLLADAYSFFFHV